ncbi:MAG: DUF6925 family protein [Betaproteobacteria bacterium]
MSIVDLVTRHIADSQTSWAIGTFGAIAEFHRRADEAVALSAHGAITARGAIRLRLGDAVRAVAWECPSSGDTWTHGVALCLSRDEGAMHARTVVTELGPDAGALREDERHLVLFDLGLGAPHCDICVRSADPEILSVLRAATGRPWLETRLFDALPDMSPTRVFLSRLGRVEVYAPIPKPGGRTPDGPHTHVLPDLLRHRRTHSANVPLPECLVPCAEMFPASPIHDDHGRQRPFDIAKHEVFQKLLAEHGDPLCMKAKRDTVAAIRADEPPLDEPSYTRAQRLARRIVLRQIAHTDGPSPALAAWRTAFDSA